MKALYISVAILLSFTLLLSSFEITLFLFHSPINSEIIEPKAHSMTWIYLLKQKYMAFIDLDIFTLYEKRHLLDVKRLFDKIYYIWVIVSILTISFILFIYFIDKKRFFLILRYNLFIVFLTILLSILILINFLDSFSFLHQLIFLGHSWVFPDNSILIEWFPLSYFQEFMVIIIFIYIISSWLLTNINQT